jgi:plasmid stabilization system protein ParE
MSYSVSFTARAQRDFAILFETINAGDSAAAGKWYRGMKLAILRLEGAPNRCPHTPETSKLRHLLYGRKPHVYRVIFQVIEKDKRVEILHIRHGARRPFRRADLK